MANSPVDRSQAPDYSAVPPAVRAMAERAERMSQNIREGRAPTQDAAPTPTQEARQQPAPAPAPTPAPQHTEAAPAPTPAPQPTPTPAPAATDDWEQRYNSLKGQFDVRNREFRELSTAHEALLRRVEQLETAPPQPAPAEQTFDLSKVLTEEEATEWGPEFGEMLGRALKAATDPLNAKIAQLSGQTQSIVQKDEMSARDRMHQTLDKDVPDWETINTDQDFVSWLQNLDEASGQRRKALLQEAYTKNDTQRVKHFFERFLRDVRGASPEAQRQQAGDGRAVAPGKPKSLDDFAAPGKGKQANAPTTSEPDSPATISRAEITAFYADKARGKLKISAEDAVKFEAEIEKARLENRIV